MRARIYYADVIEELISDLKNDYVRLMKKSMDDNNEEKTDRIKEGLIALGILEDRIYSLSDDYIDR